MDNTNIERSRLLDIRKLIITQNNGRGIYTYDVTEIIVKKKNICAYVCFKQFAYNTLQRRRRIPATGRFP